MKPTTIDDLYTYSFLGNLKSRDQTAVFVKAVANETDNTYDQVLYQWKNGTVRPLTSFGQESNFAFLDDDTIVFCGNRKKREGKTSIYELSLQGGEAQEIATLDFDNAQIAGCLGDGTLVLLIREDGQSNENDYEVFDEIPFYVNGAGITNKKRTHLYLWKEGGLTSLTSPLFDAAMVKVANDQIYVVGEEWKRKSSLMPALFQVDPSQSAWTTLIEAEKLSIQDFAPAKDGVYVFGSDCVRFGLNENPDLYRVGKDQPLQKLGEWGLCVGNTVGTDCACVGGNVLLVHENALYFTTTVEDHVELYRFTDQFERVFVMEGTIQAFTFVDGELLLIGAKTASLQELYAVRDGGLCACTTFNDEAERWVAVPQPVEYAGFDGGRMTGYVLYPKDFDPNKMYPGILDIHGGPKTVYGTVFYHEMQLWASEGYFVFYANPHGSDGASNEFADIRGKYGTIDYDDLMRFVDQVLTDIPQLDASRLGVTGGSYGGFMTNWIIGHTNRFRAAASQRSISNWISFSQTSDIGPYFTADQQAATMDGDVEKLWFHSPLKYAKNVTTPTLFIHSDEDYRCPLSEGVQMLNALLDRDIEARMCVFHGENHDLSRSGKPRHRVRRLTEITNWMNDHLK
ncbi:S9 family peptidase [uncultured Dubosiella sp.]|uniref:S9 family peptidase n=1 Tax=uncultured Dubosiella sp. TaxID=1937011 RepID=UPI0025B475DC|nr:S9 family peptidase [uncultured Dubosiella sp.]